MDTETCGFISEYFHLFLPVPQEQLQPPETHINVRVDKQEKIYNRSKQKLNIVVGTC